MAVLKNIFNQTFEQSIAVKKMSIEKGFESLICMGDKIVESIEARGKLMFCGNGGSAADGQHLVAEMVIKYLGEKS